MRNKFFFGVVALALLVSSALHSQPAPNPPPMRESVAICDPAYPTTRCAKVASDGTLQTSSGGGSGSNSAAGPTGDTPPADAGYTGFMNGAGNLVGVSPSAPFPIYAPSTLTVTVGNASIPVTGLFYQATQPVSLASVPLPTGAATAALQSTGNSTLSTSNGFLNTLAGGVSGGLYQVHCDSSCTGGGGGGGAVTAVSGAYVAGSIVDIGTGASPGGNTVNGRLSTLNSTLGSPFQAGGSIGNTSFGISGTLPAFGSTPTFNLGTLNGAATAANQATGNGYAATLAGTVSAGAVSIQQAIAANLNGTEANSAAILAAVQAPIPAQSSTGVDIGAVETAGNTYTHITTATTTTIKSSAGTLHTICVNSLGTVASTVTVEDHVGAGTPVIAVINSLALLGCQTYDVSYSTGLTVVTTGTVAPDVTVSSR
jgi:hypothetical protein